MNSPSLFDQVIGHQKAKRLLELALVNPQHGYVITGPDGVGVHPLAESFVRVLADEYKGESLLAHPDILILAREPSEKGTGLKKEISVQSVRELKVRVSERPTIASRLVVYIPDADYLNEEGVNALLKCIEEPTVSTVYVLAAHAIGRLPATLLSRIREIRLDRVSKPEIHDWLLTRGVEASLCHQAVEISDGRPGYASEYAENPDAREQIDEAAYSMKVCVEAESPGEMLGAVMRMATRCDSADDPVTEWRKALQLWQAALRRIESVRSERLHMIGRALISAERSLGSSIPPRMWLELAFVHGFRNPHSSSLFLPHAVPYLPEKFEDRI